jgi:hypothetical protein
MTTGYWYFERCFVMLAQKRFTREVHPCLMAQFVGFWRISTINLWFKYLYTIVKIYQREDPAMQTKEI